MSLETRIALAMGTLVLFAAGCREVPKPTPEVVPAATPPPMPPPPVPADPGALEPCCQDAHPEKRPPSKLLGGRRFLKVQCPHVPRGWSRVRSQATRERLKAVAGKLEGKAEKPQPCDLQAYLHCAPDF